MANIGCLPQFLFTLFFKTGSLTEERPGVQGLATMASQQAAEILMSLSPFLSSGSTRVCCHSWLLSLSHFLRIKIDFYRDAKFYHFFIVFPLHCFLFFTLVNNNAINMFSQNVFFPVRLLECPKVIQISKK